jgi:hypothetical protein
MLCDRGVIQVALDCSHHQLRSCPIFELLQYPSFTRLAARFGGSFVWMPMSASFNCAIYICINHHPYTLKPFSLFLNPKKFYNTEYKHLVASLSPE